MNDGTLVFTGQQDRTQALRIVISDYLGHASPMQLSRVLAARGHEVLHLYSGDMQSPKADLARQTDDPPGLTIEGLTIGVSSARSFFAKRRQEARFGKSLAERAVSFRPNAVMACNNPLDAQSQIQSACTAAKIPFVYWMQDFQALEIDRAIAGRGALMNAVLGGYYHALERKLLQRSNTIVPIADDMLSILSEGWDIYERQCMVVHNWSPLDKVAPGDKDNLGRALTELLIAKSPSTPALSVPWNRQRCLSTWPKSSKSATRLCW
jgi:colanic acid biosynthesis glycosyl transferase WcaI